MANLVGIVDANRDRRTQFLSAMQPQLALFDWMPCGQTEFGNTSLVWAAIPSAPISVSRPSEDKSILVLGGLSREDRSGISDADYLSQRHAREGVAGLSGRNGYYAAVVSEQSGAVGIGTDLLGLFPLYYYSTSEVLLFATTPGLFRRFPGFKAELSPHGLAGILLTMHITGGQTLWKGVRRLAPGHVLRWSPGAPAREQSVQPLTLSSEPCGGSLREHVQIFDHLLDAAIRRDTRERSAAILLSGGLDSRILAGYWRQARGHDATAITFGGDRDYEMQCAARVARRLKWRHVKLRFDFDTYPASARALVALEQLSYGFNDMNYLQRLEGLHNVSPYFLSGIFGDAVMGGNHIRWGYDRDRQAYAFDRMFRNVNRWGLAPELVKKLIRAEWLGSAVEDVVESLRTTYDAFECRPFQRPLLFDWLHRQRFHIATFAWRTSFGAWPIMPFADLEVIKASAGMPESTLLGRRAEIDLLCTRFPDLARLPLDRNSANTSPLLQTLFAQQFGRLAARVQGAIRQVLPRPGLERRNYIRNMDLSNAGWSAVRREAEPFRAKAESVLDAEILRTLLPPSEMPIQVRDAIIDGCGRRTLLAFLLWSGKNL